MRVKQLLGNDANRLLSRFNFCILDMRQTASGSAVSGVYMTDSRCSFDVHFDNSRTTSSCEMFD